MSVLPKNKQLVFSIRKFYIRDASEIFSIADVIPLFFLCFSSIFFNFQNTHIYVIKRKLHVGLKIWSSSSRGKKFFPLEDKLHIFAPQCNILYIYKFSPRGLSEPVYKYIQGQTVEGLRKFARAAHILRRNWQPIRSALSGRNTVRPQHRDHYPTLCEKCVGSFKSLNRRIERLDNVLIRENAKV